MAALDLCEPWRIWRAGYHPTEWRAWQRRRERYGTQASVFLNQYGRWAQSAGRTSAKGELQPKNDGSDAWWRHDRALTATLEGEIALRELTLRWFDAGQSFAADAEREREEIRSYAGATLAWLEHGGQLGGTAAQGFGVITPEERLRGFTIPVEVEAAARLPEQVELLAAGRWGLRLHIRAERDSFRKTFDRYASDPMRAIVEHFWQKSAAALREVEQAKEMTMQRASLPDFDRSRNSLHR